MKSPTIRPILTRSEEHTSELQSPWNLVCRLLLEKKFHAPRILLCSGQSAYGVKTRFFDSPLEALMVSHLFFNDTATTEIYTLSLHDALPIYFWRCASGNRFLILKKTMMMKKITRSEEHTSELQSPCNLVCRLLLEKKQT